MLQAQYEREREEREATHGGLKEELTRRLADLTNQIAVLTDKSYKLEVRSPLTFLGCLLASMLCTHACAQHACTCGVCEYFINCMLFWR